MIKVENLHKTYKGGKIALDNINLHIPRGSIYGLLGPNGAGKSTLINIIAGLTIKTSGKVIINGTDIDQDPRKTRMSLGVVPQEIVLDPFFPIDKTLEFYAGYYGIPKAQRRTAEILEALGLADKAKANSRALSGGMKRRVLIAKALVHNPPILILDEPTAGVDIELRSTLWEYVRELNKNGTTILLTTHYLEEAEELCDKIAIINDGKVVVDDDTSRLMSVIDKKHVSLTFDENITELPSGFANYDAELVGANSITVTYNSKELSISELLDMIKNNNLSIKDLSTSEPDLEDIFRYYVAGEKV